MNQINELKKLKKIDLCFSNIFYFKYIYINDK